MVPKDPDERNRSRPKGGSDVPARGPPPEQPPVAEERRSRHRVTDDQKSGQGSLSALSKLQMIERRRAVMNPRQKEPNEDTPR
jgi:hypothetical protein